VDINIGPISVAPESALVVVYLMAVLQSVGIPIPALLVLAPVGVLTANGQIALWQVCAAFFTGQTMGDALAYGLTVRFSPTINRIFPRLYRKVEHPIIKKLLKKGPALMLVMSCCLSWFRPIVNYLCPVLKIPFWTFLGWSFLRNVIFNSLYTLFCTGGVQLFVKSPAMRPYLIGAVVVMGIVLLVWRLRQGPDNPAVVPIDLPTHP